MTDGPADERNNANDPGRGQARSAPPSRVYRVALPPAAEPLGVTCSVVGMESAGLGAPQRGGSPTRVRVQPDQPVSQFDGTQHLTGDWFLAYMVTGSAMLRLDDGGEHPIQQGSVISLPPDSRYRITLDRSRSYCIYYVTFGGQSMRERRVCTAIDELYPVAQTELCRDVVVMYRQLLAIGASKTGDAQRELGASIVLLVAKLVNRVHERRKSAGARTPVDRAKAIMAAHLFDQVSVDEIAREAGLPTSTFRRIFRAEVGIAPYQYFLQRKIDAAKTDLGAGNTPLRAIAEKFGFADQYHFSRVFARVTGVRPTQWRRTHQ